jgi:hypothetical protein
MIGMEISLLGNGECVKNERRKREYRMKNKRVSDGLRNTFEKVFLKNLLKTFIAANPRYKTIVELPSQSFRQSILEERIYQRALLSPSKALYSVKVSLFRIGPACP